MSRSWLLAVVICAVAPSALRAQDPAPPAQQPPAVRDIQIVGTKELSVQSVRDARPVRAGDPFTAAPDQIA